MNKKGTYTTTKKNSAMTSEVTKILEKLAWLKQWLQQQAPLIDKIKAEVPYSFQLYDFTSIATISVVGCCGFVS